MDQNPTVVQYPALSALDLQIPKCLHLLCATPYKHYFKKRGVVLKSWSYQKHPVTKLFLLQPSGPVPVTPAAECAQVKQGPADTTRVWVHFSISARGVWKVLSLMIYEVKTGLQGSYLRAAVYESWRKKSTVPILQGKAIWTCHLGFFVQNAGPCQVPVTGSISHPTACLWEQNSRSTQLYLNWL